MERVVYGFTCWRGTEVIMEHLEVDVEQCLSVTL
jgi:hypothetical protein